MVHVEEGKALFAVDRELLLTLSVKYLSDRFSVFASDPARIERGSCV